MTPDRRAFALGIGALLVSPAAHAAGREPIPGGGSVIVPSPYKTTTDYPNHGDRVGDILVGYRNWRPTMSGQPECDGMIAIGAAAKFESLRDFVKSARGGLSTHWSYGDVIPGQPWSGDEKLYPIEEGSSEQGPTLTSKLAVAVIGWFGTSDKPAQMFAVANKRGVNVVVWIYETHGGIKAARRITDQVAASWQA